MTRDELIGVVISKIDEINPIGQTPEIGTTVIGRALDESAKQILRKAKKEIVFPAGISYKPDVFITRNADDNPRSVIIPLPSSYLRFLRLKMDYWKRPADSVVGTESIEYKRQFNPQGNIASVNIPTVAIIPFQWAQQDESADAIVIDDVTYGEFQSGITTLSFGSNHGFVQGQEIDIASVIGMPGLTGTYSVLFVPTPSTLLIAFVPGVNDSTTGTGGTAQVHDTTGQSFFTQALEAFPAPADLDHAMDDYQIASGANAELAEAKKMTMVKNSSLLTGNLPLIYDLQVIEVLAAEAMPDSLLDGMEWLAAGICLTSLREQQLAQAAFANATASVGQILIGMKGEEAPVGK